MDTRSLLPFSWLAPTRGGAVESNPFLTLQREMDRLFQDFGRGVGWEVTACLARRWTSRRRRRRW